MYRYILVLCCLMFSCQEQEKESCDYIDDYYQDVYEAELAFWEQDYEKTYDLLKKAESRCALLSHVNNEPLLLAQSSALTGREEEAFPYLERLLKEGWGFEMFENNEHLEVLKKYPEWETLKAKEFDYLIAYRDGLNQELREEIMEMNELDQKHRSPPYDDVKMKRIDSLNKKRMKEIFAEYGYPHYGLIGRPRMGERTNIMVMLMHFFEPEYFSPLLLESTRKGIAPPGYVGYIVDRVELNEGNGFTYGIYDNAEADQIKDFENLDSRRIAVGLPPWKLKKRVDSLKRAYYNLQ